MNTPPHIGTLNEKKLHAALKLYYAEEGDRFEVPVDRYVIDIVRGDLLIEIQTKGVASLKRKLYQLTEDHPVRLVYPVTVDKWLIRTDERGTKQLSRRKSPKHGSVEDLFAELVSIPDLLLNRNLSIDLLLIREEEVRKSRKARYRRKNWITIERKLLEVVERRTFKTASDFIPLIPDGLAEPFSTLDLAHAMNKPRRLAQQMVYCMRKMELLTIEGKVGNAILYSRNQV